MSREPLGIRHNNPGNIEYKKHTKWRGLSPVQDHRFAKFESPEYGIRALVKTLMTYKRKYNIGSIYGAIHRWAPPFENNTKAYASAVAKRVGVDMHKLVDITSPEIIYPLVEGIIKHENGKQPYKYATIAEGIRLAGLIPPQKPLSESRTLIASSAGTAAVIGGSASDTIVDGLSQLSQDLSPIMEYSDYIKIAFAIISLVSFAVVVYARIDDYRSGKR